MRKNANLLSYVLKKYLLLRLLEALLLILSLGSSMAQNRTCGKIFDTSSTSHDIVTSIQLSTNCNLTVCISENRHDIKNLIESSYSVPLKTPKTTDTF